MGRSAGSTERDLHCLPSSNEMYSPASVRVEQPLSLRISSNHSCEVFAVDSSCDFFPSLPIVGSHVQIGFEIIKLVQHTAETSGSRFRTGALRCSNLRPFGQLRRGRVSLQFLSRHGKHESGRHRYRPTAHLARGAKPRRSCSSIRALGIVFGNRTT